MLLIVAVNVYCIVAVFLVHELKRMDFVLIVMQSVFDGFFSGILGMFYSFGLFVEDSHWLCYYAFGGDNLLFYPKIFVNPEFTFHLSLSIIS